MSSSQFDKPAFLDLNEVVGLSLGVKAWFLMFRLFVSFAPELGGVEIRSEYNQTYDMKTFIESLGGEEKAESSKRSVCSKCPCLLKSRVHQLRGHCSACNKKGFGKVRRDVKERSWLKWNGKKTTAPCFCCGAVIKQDKCEAAHVTAAFYCGKATPDNIRPTCHACNKAMGHTNLRIFLVELVHIDEVLQNNKKFKDAVNAKWAEFARKWTQSKRTLSG
jgi:hypothetical protein